MKLIVGNFSSTDRFLEATQLIKKVQCSDIFFHSDSVIQEQF